jgi:hypothetical protein
MHGGSSSAGGLGRIACPSGTRTVMARTVESIGRPPVPVTPSGSGARKVIS